MPYEIKKSKGAGESVYKTLYLSLEMKSRLEQLAAEHNMSCNAVIVSMIEYCLNDLDQESG